MSIFKYFKNIPRSPSHRATGQSVIFFLQICNEVPGEKKGGAGRPPNGRQGGPVAPPRATNGPGPRARQGGLSPPLGQPGYSPLYNLQPSPSLLIWVRKFHQKSRKKERSEEKESGEALPDSTLVICRLVHLVYIFFYLSTTHLSRSNLSMSE